MPSIAANLKGGVTGGKKGRDRRDSDGMMHGEREWSSGKERGRKEGRRGESSSENKTQSIAVQVMKQMCPSTTNWSQSQP